MSSKQTGRLQGNKTAKTGQKPAPSKENPLKNTSSRSTRPPGEKTYPSDPPRPQPGSQRGEDT